MDLHPQDRRYAFHPPRYSPWLMPFIHQLAELAFLRRKFKIGEVQIKGVEALRRLTKEGHAILVAPNHADHADPSILLYVGRRHRLPFHFMAAREGFERGAMARFILQRAGAFSVDREGADLAAIKTAIAILQACRHPLVIFPEGEIYHHHERLDSVNEGVATILLRASTKLPGGRKAYLIPTCIRLHWPESARDTFDRRLQRLEQRVTWKPRPDLPLAQRIHRLGAGLLALKEEEHLGCAQAGQLDDRIRRLQEALTHEVESRLATSASSSSPIPERIRTLRGRIRKQLLNEEEPVTEEMRRTLLDALDKLFLASQLYSYAGHYLHEDPSRHRLAETIFKLEEDLLGDGEYAGPRRVRVTFDEPVDIPHFLEARGLNAKSGVKPLTDFLTDRLQALLASSNTAPQDS